MSLCLAMNMNMSNIIEKYLCNIFDSTVKIRSQVEECRNKGYGRVAEILVNDIPLGR